MFASFFSPFSLYPDILLLLYLPSCMLLPNQFLDHCFRINEIEVVLLNYEHFIKNYELTIPRNHVIN